MKSATWKPLVATRQLVLILTPIHALIILSQFCLSSRHLGRHYPTRAAKHSGYHANFSVTMPFLRRRGNMGSETDIRRHTLLSISQPPSNERDLVPSLPPIPQLTGSEDSIYLSRQATLESDQFGLIPELTVTDAQQRNASRRFSMLRHRNASDSQLSLRLKQQAETLPPIPRPPAIITTLSASDVTDPEVSSLPRKTRHPIDAFGAERQHDSASGLLGESHDVNGERSSTPTLTLDTFAQRRPSLQAASVINTLSLHPYSNRQSESPRSDASSADHIYGLSPVMPPKRAHNTTPFFKLRRNKKPSQPFFALSHLPQKSAGFAKNSSLASLALTTDSRPTSSRSATIRKGNEGKEHSQARHDFVTGSSVMKGTESRSGHSSPTRASFLRGRSSTMSSVGRDSTDDHLSPPTTRTSTSTGRKSLGDLFGLGRIRQNSELSRQGTLTPATPGSIGSKSNSLQLPRDSSLLPERKDDESPANYLARLEGVVSRGAVASALARGTDAFSAAVLRSYMRSFSFFGDPMDMAIRKLLMEAELPKETQQIDRCLQAFANRYHECNPGIYSSPDQAYFIAFSLLILHTDVFNKNNKRKMQKSDYLKNTRGEGIFDDILECFYDNISYTPFIHVEDDLNLASERNQTKKSGRKPIISGNVADPAKRATREPIDPYTLILDGNLDALRPNLKDAMHLEDHYNYLGTAPCFNLKDLQNTFFRTGVLQIVSARSRPDAFMSEQTASNPDDAHPGIVDIKVTKVGLLWRKDAKKRKTRSPWQEWGAILTGAQLYFFRNISWVKNLMHQHENHLRSGHDGIPVIFKPPLEEFKPDSLMSTHAAVALVDSTYRKHKNAFVYVRQEGLDEVLLADNEEERNDWLAKLNYAAAFRTSGVRMRGVVGANYDGQGRRGIRRLESADTSHLIQTPTGPVSIARGYIDHKMAEDIQAARRDCMQQKIREADKKVEESQKQLEEQLRNARHLLILAPIQPRTREHILLAAARLSAQLKWTRMDIWREKCHRDILIQDLADDDICSTIKQPDLDSEESTQTPRRLVSQTDCKPDSAPVPNLNPQTPTEDSLSRASSFVGLAPDLAPSVLTASQLPQSSTMETARVMSNATNTRNGSVSSNTPSFVSHILASTSQCNTSREGDKTFSGGRSDNQDDVDADERDFLKQAGLWEGRSRRSSVDKSKVSSSAEMLEYGPPAERDKLERNKIRRSLQRTLRESAGHLSHHRSKRGRDASASTSNSLDGATGETFLSRGTGSFVVHGKKASVINLGTELQTLSQEEKILCRKQQQTLQVEQPIVSRLLVDELDEAFHAAPETPFESNNSNSRRSSGAIAGTATVDSFKKPDKNKLRFQGAKSASRGGPIVASGPDSEDASCSSDGQRPSQPRTDREDKFGIGKASTDDEMPYETEGRREDEPGENDNLAEEEGKSEQEHDVIPSHPTQAVTA